MISIKKKVRFAKSFLASKVNGRPIWAQLFVTRRCDLSCSYCFETDNESKDPLTSDLIKRIDEVSAKGAGLVSFMGGEPLLRSDLPTLINYCEEKGIISYVSTNGRRMGEVDLSQLDVLEISLDGYDKILSSEKTIADNPGLIDAIKEQRSLGTLVKLHQVITQDNVEEIPKVLRLATGLNVPISFGFVNGNGRPNLEMSSYLIEKKQDGARILNPETYFRDPFSWECRQGEIYLRVGLDGGEERCKIECKDCVSACSYMTSYFYKNPLELVKTV